MPPADERGRRPPSGRPAAAWRSRFAARAGRPGAGEHAVDAPRGDDRAQQLRLEPLGDEVRDGHRPPAQEPVGVAPRAGRGTCGPRRAAFQRCAGPGPSMGGGVIGKSGARSAADPAEALVELRDTASASVAEKAPRAPGPCAAASSWRSRVPAVGRRREDAHVRAKPARVRAGRELELPRDPRAGAGRRSGRGSGPEAGMDLLGDGRAADDVAPLEHERAQPGLGQIGRGDEAVVPAADDDDVPPDRRPLVRPFPSSSPRGP